MRPDAERFLEARFEDLRRQRPGFGQGQPMRQEEAAEFVFGIMLTSLRAVGAITDDEDSVWRTRVRRQLGTDRPRSGQTFAIQRHIQDMREPPVVRPVARFERMIPVAGDETNVGFGGRLQVLGVETYDVQVGVLWRLAPPPDAEAKYADELAAYNRESEGLDEQERERGRRQLLLSLSMGAGITPKSGRPSRAAAVGLTDNLGTTYSSCGGGTQGGPGERFGRALLAPAPPPEAVRLAVTWEGRPVCDVPLG